jgi:hypothetical protein
MRKSRHAAAAWSFDALEDNQPMDRLLLQRTLKTGYRLRYPVGLVCDQHGSKTATIYEEVRIVSGRCVVVFPADAGIRIEKTTTKRQNNR